MNLGLPPQAILDMPTEELVGHFVFALKQGTKAFHPHNACLAVTNQMGQHPQKEEVQEALMEAFGWMYTEGLSIIDPENGYNGWMRLSRKARLLSQPSDVSNLAHRRLLPQGFLHPLIAQNAGPIFNLGRYDAAVYEAFKQVEIAVKNESRLNMVGSALMMEAFKSGSGPLIDSNADPNEEEGLKFVFAGAMKVFRNSTGHRNVQMAPQQAAALIIHASFLVTLIDERKSLVCP